MVSKIRPAKNLTELWQMFEALVSMINNVYLLQQLLVKNLHHDTVTAFCPNLDKCKMKY